ncbi:hypothetical protein ND926_13830 [Vibrio diabolicus]|uniref:hypothetical protein n=1 Tax=Vibrio harveyi group TaxID=717610 RepID=UPI00215FA510|nr:hypothetical protein [Vibrio diabolicus]MCR9564324.1 hypothetical protein [Vibrio alginolyticus]MCS0338544.1 hypothetical protein [Vibrio diabolicus]
MKKLVEYIVAIGGAIGLLYGAHTYLMGEFEDMVKDRLEPYQKLLIANSMYDEDIAINSYEQALTGLEKQKVDGELIGAVVTPFLSAIANSDMPFKYEHHTNRLAKLVGSKIPLDYYNANSLGWIYLLTDNVGKSIEYFNKSISLYKQADLLDEAANSYEGLQYAYLASGMLVEAIEANEKSWNITYDGYNPQATVWFEYKGVHWIKRLFKLYPSMEQNYDGLVAYLHAVYELKPKMTPQPIDMELVEKILAGDHSLNKAFKSDS